MKTHAYNRLYLEDAMNNLGSMLDCAVNAAQCDLLVFYEMFLSSGVASQMKVLGQSCACCGLCSV